MTRRSCDGAGLVAAMRAAVAHLEANVDEVNALNVFPVPDGDTGANMLATVRRALAEAEQVDSATVGDIAAAIKRGALHGARGNSGVIVSQIFGGMADGLADKVRFNGLDLAYALRLGADQAYRAVSLPVEGTILTVIRDVAEAAHATAEREPDLESVVGAIVDAAGRSVARTPTLLPILREAGVVDSGGQGLFRLFEGAHQWLIAGHLEPSEPVRQGGQPSPGMLEAEGGHGYETVFFVRPNGHGRLDVEALRMRLTEIAESVVVAGDGSELKIHAHSERPDEVLKLGLLHGDLTDIAVVNLDHQTAEVRARRASTVGAADVGQGPRTAGETGDDRDGQRERATAAAAAGLRSTPPAMWIDGRARDGTTLPIAVLAVAAGDGLEKEFRDRGAAAIVRGGQAANPSTGELLAAVDRLNADAVVILPNNRNVVLAARQVAELATRPVHIVPTRNPIEGLEAILALSPADDAATNVARMTEHSRLVRTLAVTVAVRDARIGDRRVRKGQTIVLDPDEGVVSADRDGARAVVTGLTTLRSGFELVTVLYGEDAELSDAERLATGIRSAFSGVEVEVAHGGQPLYPYLIAAW